MRHLQLALEGASRNPPSDARQQCSGSASRTICDIATERRPVAAPGEVSAASLPSVTVQSREPTLRRLAGEITAGAVQAQERIRAILGWMNRNIRKEPADVFSALDVVDSGRAECQGHAYLYAALARASGLPTRVVNGLVYSPEHDGFLFHTWVESAVQGHWQAIDPTFGQLEADATHIALVYGETLGDLVPLLDWVGKARATVLSAAAP